MVKILFLILSLISFTAFSQNISINEICTKNNQVITDGDFNQFVDWIELHNNSSADVNITGYFISDDPLFKSKWKFPAGSFISANNYLIVWADDRNITVEQHHTNFKLSSGSGFVGIYDEDSVLIELLEYEEQLENISYGRTNNGWAYFSDPTPGLINEGSIYYSADREEPPTLSLASGFYLPSTVLTIDSPEPGTSVHFTLDGSYPDANSPVYEDAITLTGNVVIRARTFGSRLPSEESKETYFINSDKDLPVVSLIIDPDFLWSFSLGIFNDSLIELRKEWERPSTVQYFRNKELKFETDNSIRLFGNTAYLLPQKSFAVFANDPINYPIFDNKTLSDFDSFILRSSSDDWGSTMFRDGFIHTLVSEKLPIDYQSYQPTVLYINGEYFGIFNLREKYNENYLENNHNVDKDKIDFLTIYHPGLWYEIIAGSDVKYLQLLDYIYYNDISNPDVFDGICEYLDIDDFTHYIITQVFIGNGSYNHNIKTWRKNDTIDGFKWMIYDTDRGYSDWGRNDFNMIYQADTIFKRLLQNLQYRNHYLQQTCSHMNASFRHSFVDHIIDSLQGNIYDEMPFHIGKWGPAGGISSMEAWEQSIQVMRNFSALRKDTLQNILIDYYNLDGKVNLHLKKTSPSGGQVYIEDVLIPYSDSIHEYFKNIPITLTAVSNFGYTFLDWEGISTENSITLTLDSDVMINARFTADCNIPNTITQNAILLNDCSPFNFEQDLIVEQGATLYCEPGVEINFGQDVMLKVKGSLIFEGTEQDPIIIKGMTDKIWKYIEMDSGNIILNHTDFYSGIKAIHFLNGGKLFVNNSVFYESGVDLDDLISGSSSEVEVMNSVFYCNPLNTKKDCIDADYIPSGHFSGNQFYNVTDDCIDIGTGSSNIGIDYNEFYDSQSFGISVGENSDALVYRNILAHCAGGIQSHTGAIVHAINNTLVDNGIGILCYHYDNTPNTGGTAIVSNTIFSQNNSDFALQTNSIIEFSYSLSDGSTLSGIGNISDNPGFVNPSEENYQLQSTSPCIDAGDILSELDPDNTRADIGALYYDQFNLIPEVKQPILVYPNPFRDAFNIQLMNGQTISKLELYNQIGEMVLYWQDFNSNEFTIELDDRGLLFLRVTDSNGTIFTTKLISK